MTIAKELLPKIKAGATVRVFESFKEGDKERNMRFEGLVLARKHGSEAGASFTVRATVAGLGVEKTFPIFSPAISKIEIINSPKKVGRSKIYYIRDISRKAIRRKMSTEKQTLAKAHNDAKKTAEPKAKEVKK
ncbi:MAG: 50S ribosomal protein L19 [bacterium]|nr:50S ribosomal protein L19 [bacterium]